jgi:hypothetical protein
MIASSLLTTILSIHHGFGTKNDSHFPAGLVTARQTHGTDILFAEKPNQNGEAGFDIVMTDKPGVPVAIKTADCGSILMVDPDRKIIAAVHAGWKGTLAKVVEKAVLALVKKGAKAERLVVAMGPSMGPRCYEVDEDVASQFRKEFPNYPQILKKQKGTKSLLDIPETNRLELIRLGVPPERIDHIDLCTHCRPDLFHSYRRDNEAAGRMISFIQLLPA